MNAFRRDLGLPILLISVMVVMVVSFPIHALDFKPSVRSDHAEPACIVSFVSLSDDEERVCLRTAMTAWQGNLDSGYRRRPDLALPELPDDRCLPMISGSLPHVDYTAEPLDYEFPPFFPRFAAERPHALSAAQQETPHRAFTRDHLLKLD